MSLPPCPSPALSSTLSLTCLSVFACACASICVVRRMLSPDLIFPDSDHAHYGQVDPREQPDRHPRRHADGRKQDLPVALQQCQLEGSGLVCLSCVCSGMNSKALCFFVRTKVVTVVGSCLGNVFRHTARRQQGSNLHLKMPENHSTGWQGLSGWQGMTCVFFLVLVLCL